MKNLFAEKNNKRITVMLLATLMTATMAGCASADADMTANDVVAKREVLSTSTQADGECEAATPDVDGKAVYNEEEVIVADYMTTETVEEIMVYEPVTVILQDGTEASLDSGIAAVGMTETGENIRNTVTVNVRDYPGASGDKIYTAAIGSEVYEISKLDNGWSVIEYNGCVAFTKSLYWVKSADYVEPVVEADPVVVETAAETTVEAAPAEAVTETTASCIEPAAAEIAANTDLYGHYMYGRCSIPSVGMSVALYMPGSFNAIYNSQSVVDTTDAAAILSYSWSGDTICSMNTEEWMVADHKNQAFSLLKNVSVDDSMYIDTGDTVTEYVCVDIQDGINNCGSEYWSDKSSGLYTMDGTRCSSLNQGGMVFYTCQENYLHVKLYFWQPV